MNCEDTQELLDDYLDGALDRSVQERLQRHIDQCDACRSRVARAQALQSALQEMPVVAPSAGFHDRVLRQARDASRPDRSRGRRPLIALAMAASLVAGIGIGLQLNRQDGGDAAVPQVAIALQEREVVQLVFRSDAAARDVTFSVRLPEGVELDGFPGMREVVWQGALQPGANLLRLPLVAHSLTHGELRAAIRQDGWSRTFSVDVTVTSPDRTDAAQWLYVS